jgi:tetratricopeptide (TPR) repeat protein
MKKIVGVFVVGFLFIMMGSLVHAKVIIASEQQQALVDVDSYITIGNALMQQGDFAAARSVYLQGLSFGEDARLLNNLGTLEATVGNAELAEDYYLRSIAADPAHQPSRMGLSVIYHSQSKYDEAIARLQELTALDSQNPSYWYDLGINIANRFRYTGEGNLDDAIAAFVTADQLSPGYMYALENIAVLERVQHEMGGQ